MTRMWRWYALAATLGVMGGCSAVEQREAGQASGVDIEPIIDGVPASGYPEAAYLNIDVSSGRGYACSGVLIAPRVVLTAGHCVDGHARFGVYVGSAYRSSIDGLTYDWAEEGSTSVNPAHHDLGLIFLKQPIALASYPKLAQAKLPDGSTVINVGRVLDGTITSTLYQAPAVVYGAEPIGYAYDYMSNDVIQPGDSGGPVFVSGTHTVAAINSGAGSGIQVLARVDLLYAWITEQVALHGGSGALSSPPPAVDAGVAQDSGQKAPDAGAESSTTAPDGGAVAEAGQETADSGRTDPQDAGASDTPDAHVGEGGTQAPPSNPGSEGAKEVEPNDQWEAAEPLDSKVVGELASGSDQDWYAFDASEGTHSVQLAASGDGELLVGIASGDTCVPTLTAVSGAKVTVSGGVQRLCIAVSSQGHLVQAYQLSAR